MTHPEDRKTFDCIYFGACFERDLWYEYPGSSTTLEMLKPEMDVTPESLRMEKGPE